MDVKHEMDKKMKYWEIWLCQSLNFLREKKKKSSQQSLNVKGHAYWNNREIADHMYESGKSPWYD